MQILPILSDWSSLLILTFGLDGPPGRCAADHSRLKLYSSAVLQHMECISSAAAERLWRVARGEAPGPRPATTRAPEGRRQRVVYLGLRLTTSLLRVSAISKAGPSPRWGSGL